MMSRHRVGRVQLAAAGGLAALLILGALLAGDGEEAPAPPAALDRIAAENRNAAITAAARMKAESEAASRAADLRLGVAGDDGGEPANAAPPAP